MCAYKTVSQLPKRRPHTSGSGAAVPRLPVPDEAVRRRASVALAQPGMSPLHRELLDVKRRLAGGQTSFSAEVVARLALAVESLAGGAPPDSVQLVLAPPATEWCEMGEAERDALRRRWRAGWERRLAEEEDAEHGGAPWLS